MFYIFTNSDFEIEFIHPVCGICVIEIIRVLDVQEMNRREEKRSEVILSLGNIPQIKPAKIISG
jgi:hypothetical protein